MPKLETDCLLSLPAWGSALLGLLFLGVCSADGDDEHNQARSEFNLRRCLREVDGLRVGLNSLFGVWCVGESGRVGDHCAPVLLLTGIAVASGTNTEKIVATRSITS